MGFTTAALVFGSSGILACTSQMAWGLGLVDPISTRSMPTRLFSDHSSADRPHQQHADCATVEVVPPLNRRLNWFERSEQLQQYKENHGDCLVPKQYKANPSLGLWVSKQRQNKRLGKLSDLQVEILDELGFVWDASESRYTQSRLEEAWWDRLDRFKHDLQVGMEGVDKSSWVAAQRREYAAFNAAKESRLTPQMVKAMEALSFCWKPLREQTWNQRFQELIDYKGKEAHADTSLLGQLYLSLSHTHYMCVLL